jgi:hypothetical protein
VTARGSAARRENNLTSGATLGGYDPQPQLLRRREDQTSPSGFGSRSRRTASSTSPPRHSWRRCSACTC